MWDDGYEGSIMITIGGAHNIGSRMDDEHRDPSLNEILLVRDTTVHGKEPPPPQEAPRS